MYVTFSARVFGGMPVEVEAYIASAEPDVGLARPYVDDIQVMFPNGRPFTPKLYNKISKKEWEELEERAIEEYYESR